jgi:hypothetical protein
MGINCRGEVRRPLIALLVALLSACASSGSADDESAATASAEPADTSANPSCLPMSPEINGSLVGQRAAAQKETEHVRVNGEGVALRQGAASIAIAPSCGSHTLKEADLASGQFVARLTITGALPRFSGYPDDIVYWWVYLDLTSGKPVLKSQFLSTLARSDSPADYLRQGPFVIECLPKERRPLEEVAGWTNDHPSLPCPGSDDSLAPAAAASDDSSDSVPPSTPATQASSSLPWYGCFLGVCHSVLLPSR